MQLHCKKFQHCGERAGQINSACRCYIQKQGVMLKGSNYYKKVIQNKLNLPQQFEMLEEQEKCMPKMEKKKSNKEHGQQKVRVALEKTKIGKKQRVFFVQEKQLFFK